VISSQARFRREQIILVGQVYRVDTHGEERNAVTFHFCIYMWVHGLLLAGLFPGYVAVAIGTFADPIFADPRSRRGKSSDIRDNRVRASVQRGVA
jgi:hypothetical protein